MNELQTFLQIGSPRILVVGDLILDRYTWGNAERISPEAPVIVLQTDQREVRLGGAASVALLLRSLGAEVRLAGVIGEDAEGRAVRRLLEEVGIDQGWVLSDPDRPTTTKERFIGRAAGRHAHQILRVDSEVRTPLHDHLRNQLLADIGPQLSRVEAVLVSDYAKGVCSAELLAALIAAARRQSTPVLIDPARNADYQRYLGCHVLIPNRAEAELAMGCRIMCPEEALDVCRQLLHRCQTQAVVVKLDSDGLAVVEADGQSAHYPTRPREVSDVTGAGDMVLAMFGVCQAVDLPLAGAARLANVAAGLEVERLGVAPVTRAEILTECLREQRPAAGKLITLEAMAALAESYRHAGRKIVFTNGCFDLLHVGHITCLQEAAQLGDVLIVAINSDASVRKLKGSSRPIIAERDRAHMLAALACVHYVLIFNEHTPHELLRRIRPDVLVKGGSTPHIVGAEIVEGYGGRAVRTAEVADVSTTRIKRRLSQRLRTDQPAMTGSNSPLTAKAQAADWTTQPPETEP